MRIVLDSSVLVAALARPGVCTQLLDEVVATHWLFSSNYILQEVARKLREKFMVPSRKTKELVSDLEELCEVVQPQPVPVSSCRDPNDLPILGTVAAAKAKLLVTVDKDLLVLKRFKSAAIIKPAEFWKRS